MPPKEFITEIADMNEPFALPPGKGPRTRLWDDDYHCLYDSSLDDRTVEEFMHDHTELNYSIDHPPAHDWRTRRSGKVTKDANGELRWESAYELLRYLRWPEIDTAPCGHSIRACMCDGCLCEPCERELRDEVQ